MIIGVVRRVPGSISSFFRRSTFQLFVEINMTIIQSIRTSKGIILLQTPVLKLRIAIARLIMRQSDCKDGSERGSISSCAIFSLRLFFLANKLSR